MIDDEYINYKYNQIKNLGSGGYGQVILAENKNTKSKMAIKYIDFKNFENENDIDKVIQEGGTLYKLIHKNIIKFEDFAYNRKRAILFMEFAEGGDLNERIKEQKEKRHPFKEEIIITWFLELCNAVQYCHRHYILHRDLKPKNVFLTKDDHIKLGDFGISKILKSIEDKAKSLVGTPHYISPEVLNGKEYSYSSDIWSLGIILYELCLLRHPFRLIKDIKTLFFILTEGDLTKLNRKCERNYSERTCNLIRKILVKNPDERPTIDQIIEECEDILTRLKYTKHYNNNSIFQFEGEIPMMDRERVNDFSNEMQNNERNSLNISQKKSNKKEIIRRNYINNLFIEDFYGPSAEEQLKRTITKINNEGYSIFNDRNKREKAVKINYNQVTDFSDNKEDNKNNLKNINKMNINGVNINFGNNEAINKEKNSALDKSINVNVNVNPSSNKDNARKEYNKLEEGLKKNFNIIEDQILNKNNARQGYNKFEEVMGNNVSINPNLNKDNEKQEYNKCEKELENKISINPNLNKDNEKKNIIKIDDFFSKINKNSQKKNLKEIKLLSIILLILCHSISKKIRIMKNGKIL